MRMSIRICVRIRVVLALHITISNSIMISLIRKRLGFNSALQLEGCFDFTNDVQTGSAADLYSLLLWPLACQSHAFSRV